MGTVYWKISKKKTEQNKERRNGRGCQASSIVVANPGCAQCCTPKEGHTLQYGVGTCDSRETSIQRQRQIKPNNKSKQTKPRISSRNNIQYNRREYCKRMEAIPRKTEILEIENQDDY